MREYIRIPSEQVGEFVAQQMDDEMRADMEQRAQQRADAPPPGMPLTPPQAEEVPQQGPPVLQRGEP